MGQHFGELYEAVRHPLQNIAENIICWSLGAASVAKLPILEILDTGRYVTVDIIKEIEWCVKHIYRARHPNSVFV